ncbi:MAG TPA: hypothetical protein VGR28_00180 [Candidatus Thermoplasmatota archaeon]|jgi:hypothetical protein|nr:hypothetical protein [Candidatus Thermoplasmatota archaeon]
MPWAWNPYALLGILPCLTAWSIGSLVYLARPRRSQNRRLAVLFALEGSWELAEFGLLFMAQDEATAFAVTALWGALLVCLGWAYLAFLGTLETPLAAPFRSPRAARVLAAGAVACAALVVLFPTEFATYGPASYARYTFVPRPWIGLMNGLYVFVWTYAFCVAFSAWRRTPRDSPRRPAARAYLLAVGSRDVYTVGLTLHLALTVLSNGALGGPPWLFELEVLSVPVVFLASQLLLAYGILRTQMFDIDLRLRWTVKQSTVAAAFIGVFFVVSEGAQAAFSETLGPIVGLAAAGLLVFALAPLQRAAERVASTAMPHVRDTAEYRLVRKREIYRAALEGALQDGVVTDKERDILARLQDQLGLSATEARALERDLAGTRRRLPESA